MQKTEDSRQKTFPLALAAAALLMAASAIAAPADVPLIDAVTAGDVAAVRALLDEGADVETATPDGATALLWAVHADQPEVVTVLLEAGA